MTPSDEIAPRGYRADAYALAAVAHYLRGDGITAMAAVDQANAADPHHTKLNKNPNELLTAITHRLWVIVGGGLVISVALGALQDGEGAVGRLAHSLTLWIVLCVFVAADATERSTQVTAVAAVGFVAAYYLGWFLGGGSLPSTIILRVLYWALIAVIAGAAVGRCMSIQARNQLFTTAFAGVLIGAMWGDVINSYRGRPVLPSIELILNALGAYKTLTVLATLGTIRVIFWLRGRTRLSGIALALPPLGAAIGWFAVGIPTTLFDVIR